MGLLNYNGEAGNDPLSEGLIAPNILDNYDGEHLTARFSVSTGVKKENSMRIKVRKNIKRIIEVYPSKYFIAKFASK